MLARLGIPPAVLWWAMIFSAVMLGLALIAVPIVVTKLPADYFAHERRSDSSCCRRLRWIRWILVLLKNLVGLGLLFLGILMLVLPGQGLLTILIAAIMIDFPGKYRLQRWVMARNGVLEAMNWIRRKANRPPFLLREESPRTDAPTET